MAKKKVDSSVFEIIVILAIVGMVAFTGQMLIYLEKGGVSFGSASLTGFAVLEGEEEASFVDLNVKSIEINPPSPLLGQSFEIKAVIENQGTATVSTPFYVQLRLSNDLNEKPTVLYSAMPKELRPGQEATAKFNVATIAQEGAYSIGIEADPTGKLDDANPANNARGKTLIITSE